MKKILAFIICIVLVCAMPVVAFAETEDSIPADEESSVTENVPAEDETVTEGENEGEEVTPEPTPEPTPEVIPSPEPTDTDPEIDPDAEVQTVTEKIEAWFERNSGAIGIIITIIGYGIALMKAINRSTKSVATSNNNSVTISENNSKMMTDAVILIGGYTEKMTTLLNEVRANEEEKQELKQALLNSNRLLKASTLANKELADEVAQLLVLANIPNSVKDELYARHIEAVRAIAEAEKTEVKEDVKQEA